MYSVTSFPSLDIFLPYLSPSPQTYHSRNCRINYCTTSLLLINCKQICSPSFYNMISLNTEIPQDFIIFILKNNFWLMFIPFISSFKITLSSKLPMYYFSQVIMSSLALFCASLLQPLTIWSILSSTFLHTLHKESPWLLLLLLCLLLLLLLLLFYFCCYYYCYYHYHYCCYYYYYFSC